MLGAIPSTVFRILGRKINIVFTILVVLFITGFAQADTIHVSTTGDDVNGDGSQGNPYATIQKGIDEASDGDTVVADGIYTGEGNVELDFLGKAITVKSENGAANCMIDCENVDAARGFYFSSGEGQDL